MTDRIRQLLDQITVLEEELGAELHRAETQVEFTIRGKRVEFEKNVREMHSRLKRNFFRWLTTDRPQNLLTGPIIYAMVVPLSVLDVFVTVFQRLCFPIYGISRVRREDYIVLDRYRLGYLNSIERFHCLYCAYANGLLAYTVEVAARVEQYFCPIKHARKVLGSHARYQRFLAYGDSADFHVKLEEFRAALASDAGAAH